MRRRIAFQKEKNWEKTSSIFGSFPFFSLAVLARCKDRLLRLRL
jgi:hypothetical protein